MGCVLAQMLWPSVFAQEPALAYTVQIDAAGNQKLVELLLDVSEARRLESTPPPSVVSRRRRAKSDLDSMREAMRSRGYYGGEIDFVIDSQASPAILEFRVVPGLLYRLRTIEVEISPAGSGFQAPSPSQLGLVPGEPAAAVPVLMAEQKLVEDARQRSYALAELGKRTVVVDHASHTMDVVLRLQSGPSAKLGRVVFVGTEGVDPDYLEGLVPWQPGVPYDPELVAEARKALVETNLFSAARLEVASAPDADGQLEVTAHLTERKHRTLKTALGFNSDTGGALRGSWTHRNLIGSGERLLFEATWSGIGTSVRANFRRPNFFHRDQALVSELRFVNEDTDAFKSKSGSASIGLERKLGERSEIVFGPAFRHSKVEGTDEFSSENFSLLYFPVNITWDFSDDLLDPTRGGRLFVRMAPYTNVSGRDLTFGKVRVRYSQYYTVHEEPRLVLAGRVTLGLMDGASRDAIPADERFYAGGGGSVRGYGFQLASPLNALGDPIGGKSLLDFSAEVRWQAFGDVGLVAFVDAGSAFTDSVPTDLGKLRFGTGMGIRYATPIGPLRFDVGVPISPRDGIDDAYQIYVSIGQAF